MLGPYRPKILFPLYHGHSRRNFTLFNDVPTSMESYFMIFWYNKEDFKCLFIDLISFPSYSLEKSITIFFSFGFFLRGRGREEIIPKTIVNGLQQLFKLIKLTGNVSHIDSSLIPSASPGIRALHILV